MANKSIDLLLDGRVAPITWSIGFFEADCSTSTKKFIQWQQEIKKSSKHIARITSRPISGNLEQTLQSLLPLKRISPCRYLFIPTASRWTAYLDNLYRGTDPAAISYLPKRLYSRSVWVVAEPQDNKTINISESRAYKALIMEIFGHEKKEWLNIIRKIRLEYDVGAWLFEQHGEPFSFEETNRYHAEDARDRFNFILLKRYLKELGLSPFGEDFYLPPSDTGAFLVEVETRLPTPNRDVTLEEARQLMGIDN